MDLGRHDDDTAASRDFVAARIADLGDHFGFEIARTILLDDADVAGAARYRVRATLAGRRFEDFAVDVGFSGPIVDPESVTGPDVLAFADLHPIRIPTLPLSLHIAEKVHAYTRRYGDEQRASTRVKDLVDLILLATASTFRAGDLREALTRTFVTRTPHPLPPSLPTSPPEWEGRYRQLARPLTITDDAQEAHRIVAGLIDPILSGVAPDEARWSPTSGRWLLGDEPAE